MVNKLMIGRQVNKYKKIKKEIKMNKERQHRRVWNQQQDQILRQLVEIESNKGKLKWKQISEKFNANSMISIKRNPKQCRERWYNSLTPNSQQSNMWSDENNVALIRACKKYGHRWSKLAKEMKNNINENRLKNHFYSTIRKLVRNLNTILKQTRKQQHQHLLSQPDRLTQQQIQPKILKQINKLRSFKPKYLSKIFSLIDSKQEYKYEAKQNLQVESIKSINDEILEYMEDFVTGNNVFTKKRILKLIVDVMQVNRLIKTKYIREVKMSLEDEEEIQRVYSLKKKKDRKINIIVKQELQHKIIPNKKKKDEVIKKIGEENKTLKKLITTINTLKIKRNREARKDESESQENCNIVEKHQQGNENSSNQLDSPVVNKIKCKNENIETEKSIDNTIKSSFEQPIPPQMSINIWNALNKKQQQYPPQQHFYQNVHIIQPMPNINNAQQQHQSSITFSGLINVYPTTNFAIFPFNELSMIEQSNKKIKNSQELQLKVSNQSAGFHKYPSESISVKSEENDDNENKPFGSNFLNTIPFLSSNNTKKVEVQQNLKQLFNPFFPEHKLSNSQGYFCFDQPNNNQVNQILHNTENDISKSNPNMDSALLYGAFNQTNHPQVTPPLRNSRVVQGMFTPFSCDSNGQKMSEQSQKLKNSAFDLFPCFHPIQTNLFCSAVPPNCGLRENENQLIKENRNMQSSKSYSHFHEYFTPRFNMFQSQPIAVQMHKYSEINGEFNPSGIALSHSYSYGQVSQDIKNSNSKIKK